MKHVHFICEKKIILLSGEIILFIFRISPFFTRNPFVVNSSYLNLTLFECGETATR